MPSKIPKGLLAPQGSEETSPQRPRFFNYDAQAVRVVGSPDRPLFVGRDVCDALGYSKYRDALALLDDDERVSGKVDTLGGPQEMTCVTESGLYALTFGSRKPRAKVFRRWVTDEVLPAIRRTGAYAAAPAQATELARLTTEAARLLEILKRQVGVHKTTATAIRPQAVLAVFREGPLSFNAALIELRDRHGHVPKSTFSRRIKALSIDGKLMKLSDGRWTLCPEACS